MNKIDLTFGNPTFLRDYWKDQDLPDAPVYYPSSYMEMKQNPELEKAIRHAHRSIGNVENVDDYEIVIGNGASQLLSAIMYETWQSSVSAPIPYFSRFPVLAQIGNQFWEDHTVDLRKYDKLILTAPNNPTGDFVRYDEKQYYEQRMLIVDACYNWPQYCNVKKLNDDIIVFSLSKATGHAGTRLGWALIKDKNLAADVRRSVEMTTMGVSSVSQDIGRFVLQREAGRFNSIQENVFSFGKDELRGRWLALDLNKEQLPFKILNNSGMFAWCEGKIPDHVKGLEGSAFGDSNSKFRLNIGCSRQDFYGLLAPYLPKLEEPELDDIIDPFDEE